MEFVPIQQQQQLILCCECGTPIPSNPANMCVNCIRNRVDITEGIPKSVTIHFCRNCGRYLQPPNVWVNAQLESRELLALCLKKLKGLSKVRLIDTGFIWTEPHSRRIKLWLTIQKEVFTSTILQQKFEVEYIVSYQQCQDCTRVAASNTWKAMVQVRQKVDHKRTFFYLEQLILKHHAHRDTSNIKETKDGIDFYYVNRAAAIKMCDFLQAVVPVRIKTSEQLISTDIHSNTSNYKFSYSVEIIPICKDDLICLPKKLAASLGNISPLVLCTRVGNSIHLMDVNTLTTTELANTVYWRTPFTPLATVKQLVEYYVLDVELLGPTKGNKWALADVQVARSTDFGRNDTTFFARSHLGAILNPGDTVMGYDLQKANYNDPNFELLNHNATPDVILVKKSYPNRRKKSKGRMWKLRRLEKEEDEMLPRKQDLERIEADYEIFLRDLEEDPELRQTVNIFKNKEALVQKENTMVVEESDLEDVEEDFPEIGLEEMLEELKIDEDGYEDTEDVNNSMMD